ncbi:FSH1-domain-containing protein [Schizopora paradoxa]|uniref:FSH1-domain-containing protein n=1 Tax=Schizopora paradoxa TaxID=27342 RepID=A0A0H2RHM4_9AGAM|nr:FSH1-domain-containing protein [Schizopora paradoxa]
MPARKVLMLHGYAQNAAILSKRMGAIRKQCGNEVDLVFVDAPHILHPADLSGLSSSALNAPEASLTDPKPDNPAETPRGWWTSNPERTIYAGASESLVLLRDILVKDRYEGVFGFSQGGAMAALLSAALERPHLHPPFLVDDQAPHPPFKFCISVSGFLPLDVALRPLFEPNYSTPTLHIIGMTDFVVAHERSKALIDACAPGTARVLVHEGGHFVPSKATWRNFFKDYFVKTGVEGEEEVPGPVGTENVPEELRPRQLSSASTEGAVEVTA